MNLKGQDRAAIRSLPAKELQVQLRECEDNLFKLKFSNSVSKLKNGHAIAHLRHHRARLATWIREKELKDLKEKTHA